MVMEPFCLDFSRDLTVIIHIVKYQIIWYYDHVLKNYTGSSVDRVTKGSRHLIESSEQQHTVSEASPHLINPKRIEGTCILLTTVGTGV